MSAFDCELGFIGAGNMAYAIARAAVDKGIIAPGRMIAFDPSAERRRLFEDMGVRFAADNAQVVRGARQVMLAVKPQMLGQVAGQVAPSLTAEHVLISIMAGISTTKLAAALEQSGHAVSGSVSQAASPKPHASHRRLIRVMPNTPLMVGLGMSAVACGPGTRAGDEDLTLRLFGAAGKVIVVDETLIDAVTAVSGSGPAYLFYLAEGMEQAARELGLAEHARLLVQQTLIGAATLLAQSPDTAGELRRKVTSPGGTTEAAVKHLDANAIVAVIVNAIKAAHRRAGELGQ